MDCRSRPLILVFTSNLANKTSSCVTFALLGVALLPMIMLVNTTPDRIPADVIAEEQEAAHEKTGATSYGIEAAH